MKTFCKNCGAHFPVDFPKTLVPPCNFWGEHGMSNVPEDYKLKIWNWIFSGPFDEAIGFGMQISFSFMAGKYDPTNTFEAMVEGWADMSELEKQDYERQHFDYINTNGSLPPPGYIKVKKKVVN